MSEGHLTSELTCIGGMIQYYDYPLEIYLNATLNLVANGTVALSTLQSHARRILGVKYDLGLFNDRYISDSIDSEALTASHVPLTLEAAHKSIVLLENHNATLPLIPSTQNISRIALIGPFGDVLNYVSGVREYELSKSLDIPRETTPASLEVIRLLDQLQRVKQ